MRLNKDRAAWQARALDAELAERAAMVSDRQKLTDILSRAGVHEEWGCSKHVREDETRLALSTGPDDAVVTFTFDADGQILTVDVEESHSW